MFGLFKKQAQNPSPVSAASATAAQIVPRIKHTDFLEAIQTLLVQVSQLGGDPIAQTPVTRPFIGDLIVTYSFDTPTQFISVTRQSMEELCLDENMLHDVAIKNLESVVRNGVTIQDLHLCRAVGTGNNLEACMLLLPNLWESLSRDFKGELLAVVPDRNTVYFMDSRHQVQAGIETISSAQILDLMCSTASSVKKDAANHALSNMVIAWRNGAWAVCGTLDAHSSTLSDQSFNREPF